MSEPIRPLADRIIVSAVEAETVSKGGIIIPDTAKEKPVEGVVRWVGTGKILDDGSHRPMTVKPGDRVLFTTKAGAEIKVQGTSYLLMREDDLLAIVYPEA